jgi:hypothetical protein
MYIYVILFVYFIPESNTEGVREGIANIPYANLGN